MEVQGFYMSWEQDLTSGQIITELGGRKQNGFIKNSDSDPWGETGVWFHSL